MIELRKINGKWYRWKPNPDKICVGCAFYHSRGLQPICDVVNDKSISCSDGIFVEASQEEIIKEISSVEEKLCPYCSKNSRELPIEVDSTSYSDQSFKVEGGFLQSDEWKLSINYCPMCGKKLK